MERRFLTSPEAVADAVRQARKRAGLSQVELAAKAGGGAHHPAELTERNWRAFATEAGLDAEMVCQEAFAVIAGIVEQYEARFADGCTDSARMGLIARRVRQLRGALPGRDATAAGP